MATTPRRRAGQPPVGLQLRSYGSEQYWAVIATQTMSGGSVGILQPYDENWQKLRPGTIPVTFIDEMKGPSTDLADYTVHVSRAWLEASFVEPSWEVFERSECRKLGVTAGIMTGLLPEAGIPVRLGTKPRPKPARPGVLAESAKGLGPILAINVLVMALLWFASQYLQRMLDRDREPVAS